MKTEPRPQAADEIARQDDAAPAPRRRARWMLHIDEPTRAALVGWLTDIARTLERTESSEWASTAPDKIELEILRGVRIRRRWRPVRLTLTEDQFEVLVIDVRRFAMLPLQIWGDRQELRGSTDPSIIALKTMAFWRDGLSEPNDETRIAERTRFGVEVRRLLAGVGARLPAAWRRIEVSLWERRCQTISVWIGERTLPIVFSPPGGPASAPHMSEALADELERLAGEWLHVSEMISRHHDELPIVQIGPPDYYSIRGDEKPDPVERLRIVASTRNDLQLVWPPEGPNID